MDVCGCMSLLGQNDLHAGSRKSAMTMTMNIIMSHYLPRYSEKCQNASALMSLSVCNYALYKEVK